MRRLIVAEEVVLLNVIIIVEPLLSIEYVLRSTVNTVQITPNLIFATTQRGKYYTSHCTERKLKVTQLIRSGTWRPSVVFVFTMLH